jgi:regulator of cell morphogenesis and NO signaling
MKMADVVSANHSLLLVLPRLGIRLGFGEQSVKEVCDRYRLDVDFVLLIFNVYTFAGYLPDPDTLAATNLQPLVPYLQSSHHYYLNERLPHIKRHLLNVASHAGDRYGAILRQFFADYEHEVQDHFAYEEQYIFPLLDASSAQTIKQSGKDVTRDTPAIKQSSHLSHNHSDLVDRLSDLSGIVLKYIPGECLTEELNELVFGIMQLSSDLEKHALLEEKLLIPYIRQALNINIVINGDAPQHPMP